MTLELPENPTCPHCKGEGLIHPPKWITTMTAALADAVIGSGVTTAAYPCPWCPAGAIEGKLLALYPDDGKG